MIEFILRRNYRPAFMGLLVAMAAMLLSLQSLYAQGGCTELDNLVYNPSFECKTACPQIESQIANASGWSNGHADPAHGTPDYFNSCNVKTCQPGTPENFGVPTNAYGTEYAHSGDAYAGIVQRELPYPNFWREYIRTTLISPLRAGVIYTVSYYVSLAETSGKVQGWIGALIGKDLSLSSSAIHPSNVGILRQHDTVIDETNGWVQVTDTFTATGGENTLVIGFFESVLSDQTTRTGSGCTSVSTASKSYYYIDDVSLKGYSAGREDGCDYFKDHIKFRLEPVTSSNGSCCYKIYISNDGLYDHGLGGFFLTDGNGQTPMTFTNGGWTGSQPMTTNEVKWANPRGDFLIPAQSSEIYVGTFCVPPGTAPNYFYMTKESKATGEIQCFVNPLVYGCNGPCCQGLSIAATQSPYSTSQYCEWFITAAQSPGNDCIYGVRITVAQGQGVVVNEYGLGTSPIMFGSGNFIGTVRTPKGGTSTGGFPTITVEFLGPDGEVVCTQKVMVSCLSSPPLG